MKQKSLWISALVVILAIAAGGFGWAYRHEIRSAVGPKAATSSMPLPTPESVYATPTQPLAQATSTTSTRPVTPPVQKPAPKPTQRPTATSTDPFVFSGTLPEAKNLAVPFLSQAPKMNWDMPYQESCEEASAIMVDAYYKGQTKAFAPEEGDRAILTLVDFETALLGTYLDTTAEETAQLIREYFGYKRVIVRRVTDIDTLKAVIANGYPVIIPADGKMLANPNFRNGGPPYHMLVMKGYTKDGYWITNDPGTRKGADFIYTTENLQESMHDWNGGDVSHGAPNVIIIMPN